MLPSGLIKEKQHLILNTSLKKYNFANFKWNIKNQLCQWKPKGLIKLRHVIDATFVVIRAHVVTVNTAPNNPNYNSCQKESSQNCPKIDS